ncbi:hypothetical protein D9619_004866 [Psilocybe cf. subviscida]|uniref:Cyanovirin-N domain-containing protein n=1 Tax=Psilocybe cf. subviscida TaxID=2480587 RepID=A0A8H5BQD3_9AGAR|nr:hypothetical protein D9619_004866 [Psilocybe cf. subviscida]
MNTKYLLSLSFVMLNIALGHAKDVCNDKHIIETTKLTAATGETITMQRFNCSNTAAPAGISRREPPHIGRSLGPVLKRSASQCTQANCMCGVPVSFNRCTAASIKASDCNILANGLLGMSSPATFFIPSGQGAAFFVETCEASVSNPISATMQYCFSDMGIATLQNTNACGNAEATSSGTFAGNTFFVANISP